MSDQDEAGRLSRPLPHDAAVPDGAGAGGGAASRGLGGMAGDDVGSGVAGLGGLRPDDAAAAAGGLDARNMGGGGLGLGQTQGVARQNQAFGLGGEQAQGPDAGGSNELQDELRAQAQAQAATDASDAEGLLDKTRAQADAPGADRNNDSL